MAPAICSSKELIKHTNGDLVISCITVLVETMRSTNDPLVINDRSPTPMTSFVKHTDLPWPLSRDCITTANNSR